MKFNASYVRTVTNREFYGLRSNGMASTINA